MLARAVFLAVASIVIVTPLGAAAQGALDGLTVVSGEAPLPIVGKGAPNYSPEQTASAVCEARSAGLSPVSLAPLQRAHEATVAARNARRDAHKGRADRRVLERTESRRQEAVEPLLRGVGIYPPAAPSGALRLLDVQQRRLIEHGRPVLVVTGRVQNVSGYILDLPPLNLYALDVRGFVLAGQTTQVVAPTLHPEQSQQFELRFRNPPEYAAKVHVGIGPPFLIRSFRGCEQLDPSRFDFRTREGQAPVAEAGFAPRPAVGEGAPQYEPRELMLIARQAYRDALDAYEVGREVSEGQACAPLQSWRDLLLLSERAEDAWVATQAALEVRRDAPRGVFLQAEVDAAELARQQAVRAMLAARPASRTISADEASPYRPRQISMRSGLGDAVIIRGEAEARGAMPFSRETNAWKPATARIRVTDRFGFTVTDSLQRMRATGVGRFDVTMRLPAQAVAGLDVQPGC